MEEGKLSLIFPLDSKWPDRVLLSSPTPHSVHQVLGEKDLLSHILSFLSIQDICKTAAHVTRFFATMVRTQSILWRHLDLSCYPNLPVDRIATFIRRAGTHLETLVLDDSRHADASLLPLLTAAAQVPSTVQRTRTTTTTTATIIHSTPCNLKYLSIVGARGLLSVWQSLVRGVLGLKSTKREGRNESSLLDIRVNGTSPMPSITWHDSICKSAPPISINGRRPVTYYAYGQWHWQCVPCQTSGCTEEAKMFCDRCQVWLCHEHDAPRHPYQVCRICLRDLCHSCVRIAITNIMEHGQVECSTFVCSSICYNRHVATRPPPPQLPHHQTTSA